MATSTPLRRRPLVWVGLAVIAVLAVGALLVFQPWKLFVDQTVDEAAPAVSVAAPVAPDAAEEPAAAEPAAEAPVESEPVELARGDVISHEHTSSGSVVILQLADGSRVLRLEDLDTSNGPRLKVWLTDAPVIDGRDGWGVFDDGAYVDLGDLKGNVGSSNYEIPADVDLSELTSVSIWCEPFAVSFAAAELTPVT